MRNIMIWGLGLAWLSFVNVAHADVFVGGHGDIGALLNANNQLELHFHFEDPADLLGGGTIPAGEYAPSAIQVGVPGPSVPRPAGNEYNFLGHRRISYGTFHRKWTSTSHSSGSDWRTLTPLTGMGLFHGR